MPTTEQQQPTEQQPVKRRALSLWQPFASFLSSGIKTVDSRSLNTNFRGEFYIHASQAIPRIVYDDYYLAKPTFRRIVNTFLQVEENASLSLRDLRQGFTLGALVGKATLADSLLSERLKIDFSKRWKGPEAWAVEEALGDHGAGRWSWVVRDPETLITPTAIKGRQMLFWPIPDTFVINS